MDADLIGILAVSGLLTIVCWIALWRGTDHVAGKLLWTVIAVAPGVGPLLFATLHSPPPAKTGGCGGGCSCGSAPEPSPDHAPLDSTPDGGAPGGPP